MTRPDRDLLVCLHFLGGSARSWDALGECLAGRCDVLAIDLPGFGDAARTPGHTVSAMADHVAAAIRAAAPSRYLLAGHSMGAKVALAVAQRAQQGEDGLTGLAGLVLLAGSPPAPEPMAEERRERMLSWFEGDEHERRSEADGFVSANLGAPLAEAHHERTVADVLRAERAAWRAWLQSGSREDWSERIGRIDLPALVVAGGEDADLGAEAQRRLMLRHLPQAELVELDGAGHLLPLERPEMVASLILSRFADVPVPPEYALLIGGERVSRRTRAALLDRLGPPGPGVLDVAARRTLVAVLDRVLPQDGPRLDLAAIVDARLAAGGDGWRFAALPRDAEAYREGLDALDAAAGGDFAARDAAAQDAILRRAMAGELTVPDGPDAAALGQWMEDVRADAVRAWLPHPASLARLGYGGIAYGGDGADGAAQGLRLPGFTALGEGERESWELRPLAAERTP